MTTSDKTSLPGQTVTKKRNWRRAGYWGLGILLVWLIIQAIITPILTKSVNGLLAKSLVPPAALEKFRLILLRGYISATGLKIAQPEGFGTDPFLEVGHAWVDVRLPSLLRDTIEISRVGIENITVNIIKDTNGVLNVSALTPAGEAPVQPQEVASATGMVVTTVEPEQKPEEKSGEKKAATAIKVHRISVANLQLNYYDQQVNEGKQVAIQIRDAELKINDLLYDPNRGDAAELIAHAILQGTSIHEDTPPAYFGLIARVGPISTNIPALLLALTVAGAELDSASTIVPAGARSLLGGGVVDLNAKVRLNQQLLDVEAMIETAGAKFPITVGGTLAQPTVGSGAVLLGAFGRIGGVFGNTLNNVASAGLDVAAGTVGVAASVGKGAANITGGMAKGLFAAAKSAATLDLAGVGKGLGDTAGSVVSGATDTAVAVGGNVRDTAVSAGQSGTGGASADTWRNEKRTRFDVAWAESIKWVDAGSYPENRPVEAVVTPPPAP